MYEEHLFKDGKAFLDWARKNADKSTIANDMIGWDGDIRYLHLAQDMLLLYQMVREGDSWAVCDMHMLLWGAQETLRKDICRTAKFWKAKASACWSEYGNILWHSSIIFGGGNDGTLEMEQNERQCLTTMFGNSPWNGFRTPLHDYIHYSRHTWKQVL